MNESVKCRLFGLLGLLVSAAFGWYAIWQPLQLAQSHAPEISYSIKMIALVPFIATFSLFSFIFGNSLPYRTEKSKFTAVGWILVIVAVAAVFAVLWWMKAQFASFGYQF